MKKRLLLLLLFNFALTAVSTGRKKTMPGLVGVKLAAALSIAQRSLQPVINAPDRDLPHWSGYPVVDYVLPVAIAPETEVVNLCRVETCFFRILCYLKQMWSPGFLPWKTGYSRCGIKDRAGGAF